SKTRIWNAASGKQMHLIDDRYSCSPIVFAPAGTHLAGVDREGRICLWDARTAAKKACFPKTGTETHSLAFSADGKILAAGTSAGRVQLWDVPGGQLRSQFQAHEWQTYQLSLSADGRYLVTAGYRCETPGGRALPEVRLWETA